MIEIVMTVCLIAAADKCEDVKLNFMAQSVTPYQCMMYGQHEISKWMEGHPKWRIQRWRCGVVRQRTKA